MSDSKYPSDWDSRRKRVYEADNYTCQNCGAKGGPRGNAELHAHHGVPLSKGGTNRMSNLTTYCKRCHEAIHRNNAMAPTASRTSNGRGASNGRGWSREVSWSEMKQSWDDGEWYDKVNVAVPLVWALLIATTLIGLVSIFPAAVVVFLLGGSPETGLLPVWLPIWFGLTAIAVRNFLQT